MIRLEALTRLYATPRGNVAAVDGAEVGSFSLGDLLRADQLLKERLAAARTAGADLFGITSQRCPAMTTTGHGSSILSLVA